MTRNGELALRTYTELCARRDQGGHILHPFNSRCGIGYAFGNLDRRILSMGVVKLDNEPINYDTKAMERGEPWEKRGRPWQERCPE